LYHNFSEFQQKKLFFCLFLPGTISSRCLAPFLRDQAYTHLKEAVDEIRDAGKYVFRQNEKRFRKYASEYRRNITSKQKQKPKKKAKK
jgi:hypothetical protein